MRAPLIITDHALMRIYENRTFPKRVQQLWQSARRCKNNIWRNIEKLEKYGAKQNNIEYYWAGGFLFTVDVGKNVLVTITPKSSKSVKFK